MTSPVRVAPLAALLAAACTTSTPFDPGDVARLEEALDATHAAQGAPGTTMMVVASGRTWVGHRGRVALADDAALVTERTPFRTASVGKTFVGALILALHDEGLLSVDDPLSDFTDAVPGGESITLRMLLQHTSGIANYTHAAGYLDQLAADPDHRFTYAELVAHAVAQGPDFPPDTGWNYSNTGYILLGIVAESIVGRPVEAELTARFFTPLGMHDTHVLGDPPAASEARWTGYVLRDGSLTESPIGHAYPADGGAWVSTLHDLTVWARAFFGGRLHRPETLALARGTGGGALLNDVAYAFGLESGGYGHGLIVARDGTLGTLLAGAGNADGARTFVGYFPDHDVSFVVAVNAGDGTVPLVETLSAAAPVLDALREVIPE